MRANESCNAMNLSTKHRTLSAPLSFKTVATVTITMLVLMVICGAVIFYDKPADITDVSVYFQSSDWVVGKGVLYRDVFSEYPLLANVIFGFIRFLSIPFGGDFRSFYVIWALMAAVCFAVSATICLNDGQRNASSNLVLLAWLLPSTLLFALLRYDIYPCLTTVFMMLSLRDRRYLAASIWMGLTIAFKGYALFLLPAFLVHVSENKSRIYVVKISLISVLPFLASLAMIVVFAGVDGLLAPFRFHAIRDFNPESSYQIFNYLFGGSLHAADVFPVPLMLQTVFALYPAFKSPRSFERIQAGFGVSLLGLVTFSVFYSPQFILWILPVLSFATSVATRALLLAYSMVTFGYLLFLVSQNRQNLIILVVCLFAVKMALLVSCMRDLRGSRGELA